MCWRSARTSTVREQTTWRYQDHCQGHEQNEGCHKRNAGSSAKPGVGTKTTTTRMEQDDVCHTNNLGLRAKRKAQARGPSITNTRIRRQCGNENYTPTCWRKSRFRSSCPKTSRGTCRQSRSLMWPITHAKTACMNPFIGLNVLDSRMRNSAKIYDVRS